MDSNIQHAIKNEEALQAAAGLRDVSKQEPKDGTFIKRLAKMLRFCRAATEAYVADRTELVQNLAKKDDAGRVQSRLVNEESVPVFEDEFGFQQEMRKLNEDVVDVAGFAPKPFTWEDMEKAQFKHGMPSAETLEKLGPFFVLPEVAE